MIRVCLFNRALKYGLFLLLFVASGCVSIHRSKPAPVSLSYDEDVLRGSFENGVKYVIRRNAKPEGRLVVRLAVNAGSVLEDEDQRGLAHFVEHMAFNGSTHFDKQELVDYLESIGVNFGADLNAYTSFDETVYKLMVPTDDMGMVSTTFQVLEDWAHGVTLASSEIEKERGVIMEEWRLGRGAQRRIRDQQYPVLFSGSRYAERLPIGDMDVVQHVPGQRLIDFYKDWYRPDLFTVVAVGDLPVETMRTFIEKHFAHIRSAPLTRKRRTFSVPNHEGTLYSIVSDPEARESAVGLYIKHPVRAMKTTEDFRQGMIQRVGVGLLSERLHERTLDAEPPFIKAWVYKGAFVRTRDYFALGASVKDNHVEAGLLALLEEVERVRRYGFTENEFERKKKEVLRSAEQAFANRSTTDSNGFAKRYVKDAHTGSVSPSFEEALELHRELLPTVSLEELNTMARSWFTESNRVVMVEGPEKGGVTLPDEAALKRLIVQADSLDVEAYVEASSDQPLLQELGKAGAIVERTTIDELGLQQWRLSNGAILWWKSTDFKEDEVIFQAWSPGGHSLARDEDFIPAYSAAAVVQQCGVGTLNQTELMKRLSGKIVGVAPYISELEEGLTGGCSPQDLETLMELVTLYFRSPRADEDAFLAYCERLLAHLENKQSDPEAVLSDTVRVVMNGEHFRRIPWTTNRVAQTDLDASLAFYRERFANAGDFHFLLVGNLKEDEVAEVAVNYLSALPSFERAESWTDIGVTYPQGAIETNLVMGLEPKARVEFKYSGDFKWSYPERYRIRSMVNALRIRLREKIREELGGSYHISAYAELKQYPNSRYTVHIRFGCDPEKMEALMEAVEKEVKAMQNDSVKELYVRKTREGQLRQRETQLKSNEFWGSVLKFYQQNGEDPRILLAFKDQVAQLNVEMIQQAAQDFLDTPDVAVFTLEPEPVEKKNE